MGSGSSGDAMATYYQQQQLDLSKKQMAATEEQNAEAVALQKYSLNKPTAAVARNVNEATTQMVGNQEAERANMNGIRSTYAMFAKDQQNEQNQNKIGAKAKLGA